REAPPLDPQLRAPPVPAPRGAQRVRPPPSRHARRLEGGGEADRRALLEAQAERRGRRVMNPEHVIRRPIMLTEKANQLHQANKFVFEVARDANKVEIREAVQKLFKVNVTGVNTMVYRGKDRRMGRGYAKMQNWKKAIVTLKEGESIDFFGGQSES